MHPATSLLRQVNPVWKKQDGTAASLAFWPFPKDEGLLSVDDGDRVTPQAAWRRFVARFPSAGVWAVTLQEVTDAGLPVREDPLVDNPEHAVVDFTALTEKQQKAKAKLLCGHANRRGCLFQAET